jgi:hypothetical protein
MPPDLKISHRATGPRSAEGKRRSAQNARRHGLTAASQQSQALEAQIGAWRADPDGAVVNPALLASLAQAQQRLADIRRYQADLIAALGGGMFSEGARTETPLPDPMTYAMKLALRYRAEAEAALRNALRAVLVALEQEHRCGAEHDTIFR